MTSGLDWGSLVSRGNWEVKNLDKGGVFFLFPPLDSIQDQLSSWTRGGSRFASFED